MKIYWAFDPNINRKFLYFILTQENYCSHYHHHHCVCVWGECRCTHSCQGWMCAVARIWKLVGNFQKSVLSFYCGFLESNSWCQASVAERLPSAHLLVLLDRRATPSPRTVQHVCLLKPTTAQTLREAINCKASVKQRTRSGQQDKMTAYRMGNDLHQPHIR